jgi:hypothetical protein
MIDERNNSPDPMPMTGMNVAYCAQNGIVASQPRGTAT